MFEIPNSHTSQSVPEDDRLRCGGQRALADLFARNWAGLRNMVRLRLDARVARRCDPSDILQEAYLDASRRLGSYLAKRPMSPRVWLRFLTRQRLAEFHRRHLGAGKRDVRQEWPLRPTAATGVDSHALSCALVGRLAAPSAAAMQNEMHDRLQSALESLPPLDREILSLRHFEELTNSETAEELGITTAAASKRYIRALERLRNTLGDDARGIDS